MPSNMVRIIQNLNEIKTVTQPIHLALGVFDGVHIGHQAVIRSVVAAAKADGGVAGVLTFDPHPIQVLAPDVAPKRILASLNHKRDLLDTLGVDVMLVLPFTQELAHEEPEMFLERLLQACNHLQTLAIGEDWKFGNQRRGNVSLLREFGLANDIHIHSHGAVMLGGERVSSTRIRQAIRDGEMQAAAAMLGRDYTVLGTVIEGRRLGRTLGFPTANLKVYNEQLPRDGVWAVMVTLENGQIYGGAGNLGKRPTVEGSDAKRMLEIHLIGFTGDLYGTDMEVRFVEFVRAEQKFNSLDELQHQIREDVAFCRNLCTS
ncbi:MAG: bifunctional riboflavin kinase/FAD synthetase [Akkermansiaceae bacterium]|nr:bifunctional riboflavin kinase/FAD synthetase [Akkermansiaceae bacterium]